MKTSDSTQGLKRVIRERYGASARGVLEQGARAGCAREAASSSCCGSPADSGRSVSPGAVSEGLYGAAEAGQVPAGSLLASLGCGNPTALAELRPGEVVLDLGSGGGIDVLLSARRVGPTGKAYGLDMTPEMLDLARRNQREAGLENVEFLEGEIERIPLPERSVDVIISNCVINLSTDKPRALAEAYRVLRPGGRLAISDIVTHGTLPAAVRERVEDWVGCVAGALEDGEYRRILADVGFVDIEIEVTREFALRDAGRGRVTSAFVRARRP